MNPDTHILTLLSPEQAERFKGALCDTYEIDRKSLYVVENSVYMRAATLPYGCTLSCVKAFANGYLNGMSEAMS